MLPPWIVQMDAEVLAEWTKLMKECGLTLSIIIAGQVYLMLFGWMPTILFGSHCKCKGCQ